MEADACDGVHKIVSATTVLYLLNGGDDFAAIAEGEELVFVEAENAHGEVVENGPAVFEEGVEEGCGEL